MIIADANLLAYLVLPGERTELAEEVLAKDPAWAVPPLWRSELRSVLSQYVRRGALTVSQAGAAFDRAELVIAGRQGEVDSHLVFELASRSRRSSYDCEYVALATELDVQLVTTHGPVLKAFQRVAVSPERFLNDG